MSLNKPPEGPPLEVDGGSPVTHEQGTRPSYPQSPSNPNPSPSTQVREADFVKFQEQPVQYNRVDDAPSDGLLTRLRVNIEIFNAARETAIQGTPSLPLGPNERPRDERRKALRARNKKEDDE